MDETRLREIEERAKAATPGPWRTRVDDIDDWGQVRGLGPDGRMWTVAMARAGRFVSSEEEDACRWPSKADPYGHNAEFIAHAREDVPALVEEIRRLRAGIAKALDAYTYEAAFEVIAALGGSR
jgi:hypothetical protein